MNAYHSALILDRVRAFFADRPSYSVSEWCLSDVIFDEPGNRGPFMLSGREYAREPLDMFGNYKITDQIMVWGAQCGKTGVIMGGASYILKHEPSRFVWVMPNADLAKTFSETRWIPMLMKTMPDLIPTGADRHDLKNMQQIIGNSILNFFGSNSPANLSSNPARVIIQDEVDKFNDGTGSEADAVQLADLRAKNFPNPKRVKTSTPTLTDGLIWQELRKTDLRRRFLPCPGCSKPVVLAWSKSHTVFPIMGYEAFIEWDKEAKRVDGSWDFDRVERSSRYKCPHCGFHIVTGLITKMDRAGVWKPTQAAESGFVGYHLPSMYAPSVQTSAGKLAIKFIKAQDSLSGIQGFINSELAEPWENQDSRSERSEIIITESARLEGASGHMTVDVQERCPFFWIIVRDWRKGYSRLVDATHCDTWEEVREIQLRNGVQDNRVFIDSGHKTQEVYENCLKFGKLIHPPNDLPQWVGWMPSKGRESEASWKDPKTGQPRPFFLGSAALPHKRFRLPLLEFNSTVLKDVLARLRKEGKPYPWELNEKATDEYFRHMDSNVKVPVATGRSGKVKWIWKKRSERWPDHLYDDEIQNIAGALLTRNLVWSELGENENANSGKTTLPKGPLPLPTAV